MTEPMTEVMTFYRFVDLEDLETLSPQIDGRAAELELRGTVLLAQEGINGTLTGSGAELRTFRDWLTDRPAFADMTFKFSAADPHNPVFYRLKVRIKDEIVSMGQTGVDPARRTGVHVDAATWNALLDDPEVLVIDTRNSYEIEIGSFPGAVDPGTRSFRQFPAYVDAQLDPSSQRKIAMFCTGGIRCEKASSYLLECGFNEVYQLDGGVLKYLEMVSEGDNRWQGECFVFDQRVSVDDGLKEGSFVQCFACRRALGRADLESPDYVEGVSCPHCIDDLPEERAAAFRERRRQVLIAEARGSRHLGPKSVPS